MMLKAAGKAFRIQKHTHSYPHSWRTDKPVLYYPLDAWFIKTSAVKDEMVALNTQEKASPDGEAPAIAGDEEITSRRWFYVISSSVC